MKEITVHFLGGFRDTIKRWITGVEHCPDPEGVNVVYQALVLIQQDGVIAMLLLLIGLWMQVTKQRINL